MHRLTTNVCAGIALVALSSGLAHAADTSAIGKRFIAKTSPRLTVTSKDLAVVVPARGSNGDPRCSPAGGTGIGGTLEVRAGSNVGQWTLPCENWEYSSSGTLLRYRNREAPTSGGVKIGRLKTRLLRLLNKNLGDTMTFTVPSTAVDVDVVLTTGFSQRYCLTFPASSATRFDGTRYFAQNPAVAGTCPPLVTTTSTTVFTTSTTSTTVVCSCCDFTKLAIMTGAPQIGVPPPCGTVTNAAGATLLDLDCGGLYFGGSGVQAPLPAAIPDMLVAKTKVVNCNTGTGDFDIAATTIADTGSSRDCSAAGETNPEYPGKPGCLFGPPLPLRNEATPALSVCIVNRVGTSASGSGNCLSGQIPAIEVGLLSDVYLTGDHLSRRCNGGPNPGSSCSTDANCSGGTCVSDPEIQPCPICHPVTNKCNGGPRDGLACTPGDSASLGTAYPTSHDCPPPGGAAIGTLGIPFLVTTMSASKTATDADGTGSQTLVFCGFCRNSLTSDFQNPPVPCTSTAQCTALGSTCQQRNDGAFGQATAKTITETGSPVSGGMDCSPKASTLVGVFCVPPSFSVVVDTAGDLPSPGALSLIGTAQGLDPVFGTTSSTIGVTTTSITIPVTTTTTPTCGNLATFVCNAGTCPMGQLCLPDQAGVCACTTP